MDEAMILAGCIFVVGLACATAVAVGLGVIVARLLDTLFDRIEGLLP